MKYIVSIIYNNGSFSVKVGDDEIIKVTENLMDRFKGWAFLGFNTFQFTACKSINVSFASVCETNPLDEIFYYWLMNSQFINGAQQFVAGSSQRLYLGLRDSVGNNVPHFNGEFVTTLSILLDGQNAMVFSDPRVNDENYLLYNVQVPKIAGDYNLSVQISGRTGRTVAPLKVTPKGFDKFAITRMFDEVIRTDPMTYSGSVQFITRTYSWDNLRNRQFLITVESQDEFGNFFEM
jgi:hypothetical protein